MAEYDSIIPSHIFPDYRVVAEYDPPIPSHISDKIIISRQQGLSCAEAHKYRNILYKTLEPSDVFNGKKMIEFDFWTYAFGEHVFYLPRPQYLLKLGDIDSWTTYHPDLETDPLEPLKSHLVGDLTIEKVARLFPKPEDPTATILDIFDSSKAGLEACQYQEIARA